MSSTPRRISSEKAEPKQNHTADRNQDVWRRRTTDTKSAPSTPTGFRTHAKSFRPEVPILPVRVSSFGSDALSVCTPDFTEPDAIEVSLSSSSSVTTSTNVESSSSSHIRNVNLYDLIDEEFVVNCGASLVNRSETFLQRRNSHCSNTITSKPGHRRRNTHCSGTTRSTSRPGHRRRKSILDMIDRIVSSDDENTTSVMTLRSYPRGVYVVPSSSERDTCATGNTVAFVSAEAYNQW